MHNSLAIFSLCDFLLTTNHLANFFLHQITIILKMSSHLERNLHEVSVLEIQTFSLYKPEASQQQHWISGDLSLPFPSTEKSTATALNEGILDEGEPAELFDVVIEDGPDGIHALAPVSTWPETGSEPEQQQQQQPESSRAQARKRHKLSSSQVDETVESHEQEFNRAPPRKKHHRTAANVKEAKELIFQLFMSERAPEEYILETYEVETSKTKRCRLLGCGEHGQWNVRVSNYSGGMHATHPVLQDPCPAIFYEKYKLGLQDRLRGWSVERRARGTGMKDKFYYHSGRQFRSLVEVGKYILYSYRQKDLKQLQHERSLEGQEADTSEAILELSSEPNNTTTESLNKEIEIRIANAVEATMQLSSEPDYGGAEDVKMDNSPLEIENPAVVMEPQIESGDHDMDESRNPSTHQSIGCEGSVIPDSNYNFKDEEPKAVEAVDPLEGRNDEPDENNDENPLEGGNAELVENEDENPLEGGNAELVENEDENPLEGGNAEPAENEDENPLEGGNAEQAENEDENPLEGGNVEPAENEDENPLEGGNVEPAENDDENPLEGGNVEPAQNEDENPLEGGNDEPDENVESPHHPKDDIFSNLPEIENLDSFNWDENVESHHRIFEEEDDIFFNFHEIDNLDDLFEAFRFFFKHFP